MPAPQGANDQCNSSPSGPRCETTSQAGWVRDPRSSTMRGGGGPRVWFQRARPCPQAFLWCLFVCSVQYCGNDRIVDGNADTLYYCVNGAVTKTQSCGSAGCTIVSVRPAVDASGSRCHWQSRCRWPKERCLLEVAAKYRQGHQLTSHGPVSPLPLFFLRRVPTTSVPEPLPLKWCEKRTPQAALATPCAGDCSLFMFGTPMTVCMDSHVYYYSHWQPEAA